MTMLLEAGIHSSALALMRPQFETYVRGAWIADCASQRKLAKFIKGEEVRTIADMVADLERTSVFSAGTLGDILRGNWRIMCGFTHGGIEQVLLYQSEDAIERTCTDEQIESALLHSGAIALLAGIGIARLANDGPVALRLLKMTEEFMSAASTSSR